MQLWWISLSGGEAEPLTYLPGGVRSFQWSPDGKSIAFIRTDTDTPEERERKQSKNDQNLINRDYKYDRLWIYDLASRQARLLTAGDLNIDTLDWSPDNCNDRLPRLPYAAPRRLLAGLQGHRLRRPHRRDRSHD